MFETVFSLQTSEEAARLFFYGLALVGGVFGAFLPPIGRLSRLPYFFFVVLIYAASFGLSYAVGQSLNITLVFSGYILVGILAGVATAWIARARSVDIVGDGRYAFVSFIPLATLYLVFAGGRFVGENVTKTKSVGTKIGLGVAAIVGVLLAVGAPETQRGGSGNQFAKEVAVSVMPGRLDSVTLLLRAEAVGNRVRIYHTFEGPAGSLSVTSFEQIKMGVCADTDMVQLFSQAGVDREFIYLDKDGELLGSFVAGC